MAEADLDYITHIHGLSDAYEWSNMEWVERKAVEIEERRMFDANANVRHEARLSRG